MKTTQNYGLRKPEPTDFYNVDDFNFNADVIDTELFAVKQKVDQTESDLAAHLNEIAIVPAANKIPRADASGKIDSNWLNGLLIGNNPVCILEHSADQAIPGDGSLVALAFDFEWIDTDNMHSTTTNNSRITINTPGIYLIYGFVVFGNQSKTGTRSLTIRKNGTTLIAQNLVNAVQLSSFTTNLSIAAIANLAIGDYVELLVSQNSGVTLTVPTNITEPAIHPGFGAIKVG